MVDIESGGGGGGVTGGGAVNSPVDSNPNTSNKSNTNMMSNNGNQAMGNNVSNTSGKGIANHSSSSSKASKGIVLLSIDSSHRILITLIYHSYHTYLRTLPALALLSPLTLLFPSRYYPLHASHPSPHYTLNLPYRTLTNSNEPHRIAPLCPPPPS